MIFRGVVSGGGPAVVSEASVRQARGRALRYRIEAGVNDKGKVHRTDDCSRETDCATQPSHHQD